MDALEAIFTRRSIRKYTGDLVGMENIKILLEAAMQAPSAGNKQPWHFIIVRDNSILAEITKFHPFSKMLNECSLAILVCADTNLELFSGYWVIDCSNASENILIAAHALGLGAVWLGIYPRSDRVKAIKELFELPENIEPLSLISIGYPAEFKEKEIRFIPERVHYDKW